MSEQLYRIEMEATTPDLYGVVEFIEGDDDYTVVGRLVLVEPCEHGLYDPHVHTTDGRTRSMMTYPADAIAQCPGSLLDTDPADLSQTLTNALEDS